ncbi:MAG TPA: hypothetical protein VFJ72_02245 [Rubrobacteraceae bacterium]|nr:hypothetical protein [Rubrobacteraceae bacterium]
MFWKRNDGETREEEETPQRPSGPIQIERDAQRPATILRVAGELEERGGKILELFKEVQTSDKQTAVIPIHAARDGREFFVEVATRPWTPDSVESTLRMVSVVRNSDYADTPLDILSAYPVPQDIEFFFSDSPVALFQLELMRGDQAKPEQFAEIFRQAASRHWDTELDYETSCLPLVEELLTSALDADDSGELPPILNALVEGLGCFTGEVIRRESGIPAAWETAAGWGDSLILAFDDLTLDSVGKARAFLHEGKEDSISFYAEYALRELKRAPSGAV